MQHSGPWSPEKIRRHLENSVVPIRLGCRSMSGYPVVLSLWYVFRNDELWCATTAKARVVSMLRADSRCGFEVAGDQPPYRGVRGQGQATLHPELGEEILGVLIDRYLRGHDTPLARWLLARSESEVAIRIEPFRITSWDYSERMSAD